METLRKAAGVSSEVYIFLATGNRMKRVKWHKSGTFADLLAAHKKGESVEFSPAAPDLIVRSASRPNVRPHRAPVSTPN